MPESWPAKPKSDPSYLRWLADQATLEGRWLRDLADRLDARDQPAPNHWERTRARAVEYIAELKAAAVAREALIHELTDVLGCSQWSSFGPHEGDSCPMCDRYAADGHAPDCRIAAALAKVGPVNATAPPIPE